MLIPRFHPLIVGSQWYICDGHADTEHSLAVPHIDEPCESYEEAQELCVVLNDQEPKQKSKRLAK